jgi:O-antigen ligase
MRAAVATPRARLHAKAADPRSAAFAVAFGAVAVVGSVDGGYYAESWTWIALGLAAVAGIRLALGDPYPDRRALVSLIALAGLTLWMLLSASWGIAGTEAAREAARCAMYAVGLAALVVVARPVTVRALLAGVLCGGLLLGVLALAERFVAPRPPDPFQGTLLFGPVGYANALGILVALSLVLAVGLLLEPAESMARVALVAAAGVSTVALLLTSSRGAWLATLVGLLALAAARARSPGRVAIGLAALLGFCAVAALAAPSISIGDRPAYWRAAASDASAHPFVGSGAGSFGDYWLVHRPISAYVQDAHSLYLETAAELGVVGLALLGCALLVPLATAVATRRQPHVPVATAAYVTFLVHAGLDWDWEMPATTFAGLACGAALLASDRGLSRS